MNLRKALCNLSLILCCAIFCAAQVPVSLAPVAQQQFLDANGNPLAFGCVYTYQSGTTTGLATYADYTGLVQNPNPIVLSASGAANIWLQAGQLYTIQVISAGGDATCSLGTTMYTVDGVGGGTSTTSTTVATSTSPLFNVIASLQLFKLTITGNTVALPVTFTNVQAPALITFQITEDGVGGHTFAWPTNVTGGATIDTAANHTTTQTFVWNGTTILPVGSAFNSTGNSYFPGNISSTNTYTGANTFSALQTFSSGLNGSFFRSATANPSATGVLRLSDPDSLCWRNNANAADLCISKNTSDQIVIPPSSSMVLGSDANGHAFASLGATPLFNLGAALQFGSVDSGGNTADIAATSLGVPTGGANSMWRVSCYVSETVVGSVSSTLPACQVLYTDGDTNVAKTLNITSTSTANTLGTVQQGSVVVRVKGGVSPPAFQYATSGYASSAAGMTFAVHIRVEEF